MPLNHIICAAGEGSRFKKTHPRQPKPLIQLKGKSLLERSIESLPLSDKDALIIITQKSHGVKDRLQDKIHSAFPVRSLHWIELKEGTKGQLDTALRAEKYLDGNPVAIFNSDTYFKSASLPALIQSPEPEGIIPCSEEPGTAWSFCRIDSHNRVLEVREKERISSWATVGFYFFRNPDKFLDRARNRLKRKTKGEYFVAPLYQDYIEAKEPVVVDRVSEFRPMGTPEQIERYWGKSAVD